MPHPDPRPTVSVVLLVGTVRHRAERCLAAVLAQDDPPEEVLVLDVASDAPPLAGSDRPRVRRIALPPDTVFGAARALGAREARSQVVAFVEEHAAPCPGWLAATRRAFGSGLSGIGPLVLNANPGVGFSNLTYALGYGLFRAAVDRRPTLWIPSHNSAFRRAALLELGHALPELLGSENVLRQVLWKRGHRFAMEPDARILHWNECWIRGTPMLYFHYHRTAAAAERAHLPERRLRRLMITLGWPLIPFYSWLLLDRRLRRHRREDRPIQRGEVLRRLPTLLRVYLLGAAGRALGNLGWAGRSAQRFTTYELTLPRDAADLHAAQA
ncbi:MAG TPA: glycosyltransferase [Thermoanaerobaculia bacterium]|nr:glycosyltransferase [Thermoanaerobaculia bacterium]